MKTIDILTIGNVTEDINKINNKVYKSIMELLSIYKVAKTRLWFKNNYRSFRKFRFVKDWFKNIISQKLNYIQFLKIHIKMVKETKKY